MTMTTTMTKATCTLEATFLILCHRFSYKPRPSANHVHATSGNIKKLMTNEFYTLVARLIWLYHRKTRYKIGPENMNASLERI